MLLFRGASQLATHESMISSCRRCSSASSAAWAKNCLSGGFTSDGLRLWALLSNFGQESFEQLKSQEIRKRRRLLGDDESQPYVDLFSKRISDESNDYLKTVPSPSDTIARAFFGSKHFMAERMVLTPIYLLSSTSSTTLPCTFSMNDRFLTWRVVTKSPLELILSWQVGNVKGVTMMGFDPSQRKAYHGNCIDIKEDTLNNMPFVMSGIRLHKTYAQFLLDGMVKELTRMSTNNRND